MKRIASIQDISCLGRCSLTVALPVISALGWSAPSCPPLSSALTPPSPALSAAI